MYSEHDWVCCVVDCGEWFKCVSIEFCVAPDPYLCNGNDDCPDGSDEAPAVCSKSRSTQPCIPPGSLNRVPASAGVRAGMSPLPGGR